MNKMAWIPINNDVLPLDKNLIPNPKIILTIVWVIVIIGVASFTLSLVIFSKSVEVTVLSKIGDVNACCDVPRNDRRFLDIIGCTTARDLNLFWNGVNPEENIKFCGYGQMTIKSNSTGNLAIGSTQYDLGHGLSGGLSLYDTQPIIFGEWSIYVKSKCYFNGFLNSRWMEYDVNLDTDTLTRLFCLESIEQGPGLSGSFAIFTTITSSIPLITKFFIRKFSSDKGEELSNVE
jgi:hypothetical protein